MDFCLRVLKESNKSRFDSYRVGSSVLVKIRPGLFTTQNISSCYEGFRQVYQLLLSLIGAYLRMRLH